MYEVDLWREEPLSLMQNKTEQKRLNSTIRAADACFKETIAAQDILKQLSGAKSACYTALHAARGCSTVGRSN